MLPHLQWAWLFLRLPPACLFDELAVDLVLQLGVCETHLQCTLCQCHMIVYGWSVDDYINKELACLQYRDGVGITC